jgi:hypothetical protein
MVIFNKAVLKFIGSVLLVSAVAACTSMHSTKPNDPFVGPFPDKFNQLSYSNPELAKEIAKLPELQDGISDAESNSIEKLCDLYAEDSDSFDKVFDQMNKIGKPEVRKYNSLLQALYWLFEDGQSGEAKVVINDYDWRDLLDRAWWSAEQNYEQKGKWLQSEARKLYGSCTDESLKKQIMKYSEENPNLGHGLAIQYTIQMSREYPDKFGHVFDESKFDATLKRSKQRWFDFDAVIDRLNSPETIEYWTRKNIIYKYYFGPRYSNYQVFNQKQANCYDFAEFVRNLLTRSGYLSGMLLVEDPPDDHIIPYFKDKGKIFLILKDGVIFPYDSLSDIPFKIIKHQ